MNLLVCTFSKGHQWRAHGSVVENASSNKRMLQRHSSFHMATTVVNGFGQRQQLIVQLSSSGVILGLACFNHLDQKLGSDVSVSDKEAVNIKGCVQEVFVVAGKDLEFRTLFVDDGDLDVPATHVVDTVLHCEYARLCGDVEHSLQAVCCLGVVGVLEQDERKLAALVNDAVVILRCSILVSEAQTTMGRVIREDQPLHQHLWRA